MNVMDVCLITTICQVSPLCHLLLHYSWDCLTATTAQENAGTNWKRCIQYNH